MLSRVDKNYINLKMNVKMNDLRKAKCKLIGYYIVMNILCISICVQNFMKILFADWYVSNMPIQFFYMGLSWAIGFVLIWAYCKRKNDVGLENTYAAQEKIYNIENYLGLTFIVLFLLKKPMTIPAIIVLILFTVLTVIFVVRTTKFMIDLVSGKFDE